MGHDATESGMDVPWWTLTPAETQRMSVALNRAPRVIPELRALIEDYCDRDSCWLEPGHDGECKPGGCAHAGRGA